MFSRFGDPPISTKSGRTVNVSNFYLQASELDIPLMKSYLISLTLLLLYIYGGGGGSGARMTI